MKCPKCGADLELRADGGYHCPSCNANFSVRKNTNAAKAPEQPQPAPVSPKPKLTRVVQAHEEPITPIAPASEVTPANEAAKINATAITEPNEEQEPQNIGAEAQQPDSAQAYVDNFYASDDIEDITDELGDEDEIDDEPEDIALDGAEEYAEQAPAYNAAASNPDKDKPKYIRDSARPHAKQNLGYCVLTEILLTLVKLGSLLLSLVFGPVVVGGAVKSGYAGFYLDVARGKCEGTKSTYRGFNDMVPGLWLNVLIFLISLVPAIVYLIFFLALTLTLGAVGWVILMPIEVLVLIAMMFVNSLSDYAFFALNAGVSRKATELIKYSFGIVGKNFGKILLLKLSFIGWWLLVIVTFGALYFYVSPYYKVALAKQYLILTGQDVQDEQDVQNEQTVQNEQ